jgi:transcriptional regulator with XRE-family HTH domain
VDRETLIANLRDKEYRDEFVAAQIDMGIPFQIRAMREEQETSQQALAEQTDMAQARISLLERPGYGRLSLNTLKRLASAFDVALIVRFVPYSELVDWVVNLSPESLNPPSFDQDSGLQERSNSDPTDTRPCPVLNLLRPEPQKIPDSLMSKATGNDHRPINASGILTSKWGSAGKSIAQKQSVGLQDTGSLLATAGQGAR